MAIALKVDAQNECVFLALSGNITLDDFADTRARLLADATWRRHFTIVIDLGHTSETEMKSDEVRQLAEAAASFSAEAKRIIVAPRGFRFGLARMFQSLADSVNVEIVDSMDKALAMARARPRE